MPFLESLSDEEEYLVTESLLTLVSQCPKIFAKGDNAYFDGEQKDLIFEQFVKPIEKGSGIKKKP